jgi:pseudouridine-5'-phosphate glycosidase
MPYPQNVETAREVEKIIRSKGYVKGLNLCFHFKKIANKFLCSAIPATIAILDGIIKIGVAPFPIGAGHLTFSRPLG